MLRRAEHGAQDAPLHLYQGSPFLRPAGNHPLRFRGEANGRAVMLAVAVPSRYGPMIRESGPGTRPASIAYFSARS